MERTETTISVSAPKSTDAHPSPRVLELMRSLLREHNASHKGRERRAHLRYPVSISVRVTPLDKDTGQRSLHRSMH
jgi:CCR4-NOT transcriptional regulation complex NOT5 subunit